MVCTKLSNGNCGIVKSACNARYSIKMINYKHCPKYKNARAKISRKSASRKSARKSRKR